MTAGIKATVVDSINNALLRATGYTGAASLFIQLHTGDPGAAGTSNVATNNTRKAIAWNASASGVATSNGAISWVSVPATETYTFLSIWDAVTVGNFQCSGTVSGGGVTTGDTFAFPDTAITCTFTKAA